MIGAAFDTHRIIFPRTEGQHFDLRGIVFPQTPARVGGGFDMHGLVYPFVSGQHFDMHRIVYPTPHFAEEIHFTIIGHFTNSYTIIGKPSQATTVSGVILLDTEL